jgi:hypothetical protein
MAVVVVEPGQNDGHGRLRGGQEFMYAMASGTLPGAVRDAAPPRASHADADAT